MAPLPLYRYSSLRSSHDASDIVPSTHFRLLVLHGSDAAGEISCSLEQHCLASAPDYEAISYVWGDPADTCDIICSGQQLKVTKSLYSALCQFRSAGQKRTLWADAICINQQDLEERSTQVSIMGKIYSQARRVLIWLGEETDRDSEAFDVMLQLEKVLHPQPLFIRDIRVITPPETYVRMVNSIPQSSWLQIANLLQRPWFQRVWVIQEVLAAQSAQIFNGSSSMAWCSFAEVAKKIVMSNLVRLFDAFSLAPSALKNIVLMRTDVAESSESFFRLLCLTRNFKSTDPRDKLYALAGINDPHAVSHVNPDYTIEASRLFTEYTRQELLSGSLDHLSAINYIDDRIRVRVPTWVPDWTRPVEQVPLEALVKYPSMGGFQMHAGGKRAPRVLFSSDLLIITGKRVSSVHRLGTVLYSELSTMQSTLAARLDTPIFTALDGARTKLLCTQWLVDWMEDCHRTAFGDDFSSAQEMLKSADYRRFCKALCHTGDVDFESPFLGAIIDRLTRFYSLLLRSLQLQKSGQPLDLQVETELVNTGFEMEAYFAPIASHRFLCSDDIGRLAWVPMRAQAGDVICIFHGAKLPHLLRPIPDGQFEMIGACYLQDCMDGEVIGADEYAEEDFLIV